jgi:hypothetical protein
VRLYGQVNGSAERATSAVRRTGLREWVEREKGAWAKKGTGTHLGRRKTETVSRAQSGPHQRTEGDQPSGEESGFSAREVALEKNRTLTLS